jgi:hypothetical protein
MADGVEAPGAAKSRAPRPVHDEPPLSVLQLHGQMLTIFYSVGIAAIRRERDEELAAA